MSSATPILTNRTELATPCLVVGDAHLGIVPAEVESTLLAWLRYARSEAKSVVIMGDLFDFWFAWKRVMPSSGYRVLAALADISDAGIPILWMGGNHDCWGGDTLSAMTGAHYTLEPWRGRVGNWRAELHHGDGLREEDDAPYRRLRSVVRHPLAIRAFGWLHPDFATRVALATSDTSRNLRARDGGKALLTVATARLAQPDAPDLVIHGHTHVPMLQRAARGSYANAGAWYVDRQYLRIDADTITLLQWDSSGEGHVLNTLNRVAEESPAERKEIVGGV